MRGAPGRRVRFPIAAMMALIALLAVEMASLRVASDGYVDLSRHLTVAMLAVATYLARYRDRGWGDWWFGFALAGWAYFALVIEALARMRASTFVSTMRPVTFLGLLLDEKYLTSNRGDLFERWWNQFHILQSIFTLWVASLGGLICWIWNGRRGTPYHQEQSRSGKLELGGD